MSFALQRTKIITQEDQTRTIRIVRKWVSLCLLISRLSSSPTLFNLYMGTLPKHLQEGWPTGQNKNVPTTRLFKRSQWERAIFAYDVKVQTNNGASLQILLDDAKIWARKYAVTWSTNKYKILQKLANAHSTLLILARKHLDNNNGTKYLSVTVTTKGLDHGTYIQCINNTMKLAYIMQRMGIHSEALTTNTMISGKNLSARKQPTPYTWLRKLHS